MWTRKADVPGGGRANAAIAFSIDNKGYIGGGIDLEFGPSDFQEYNPITNTWTQKRLSLSSRQSIGFVIGNRVFIGTGEGIGSRMVCKEIRPGVNECTSERVPTLFDNLTEYNFSNNTTTTRASVPSAGIKPSWDPETRDILPGRSNGIGFSVGGRGYIGLGRSLWSFVDGNVSSGVANDLWEYCP